MTLWGKVRVAEERFWCISLRIPEHEHVLVSKVLLYCAESLAEHIRCETRLGNGFQQQRMNEQLSGVKHLPPVRETLLRKGEVRLVRHVSEGNLLARPVAVELPISPV